jgi:transaldolase
MLAHVLCSFRATGYGRSIHQSGNSSKPAMKFFADTAEISEIQELANTGLLDGVTTNPTLIHKSGRNFIEVVGDIAKIVKGPVSAEVVALDYEGMMREADVLRKIADNIAVKVPLTPDGLKACKALAGDGTMVNVTLCFSAAQALLAAKAGATFISPFIGRLDDISTDGMELIADIRLIYDNYDFPTQILAASIRHPMHVVGAAKFGADVMTAPPKIIWQLFKHPLTDAGIASFLKDWQATAQKIA